MEIAEFCLSKFNSLEIVREKMEFSLLSDEEFKKFAVLIHEITGIYLKESKISLLSNRLRKRLKAKSIKTYDEYYNYVIRNDDSKELDEMLNAVSTNETYFFRSIKHYEALMDFIVPEMINNGRSPIKVWSAGSASGEEAYTLAMLLDEKGLLDKRYVKINGSDINTMVLDEAKKGVFDYKRLRGTPEKYISKYFKKFDKNNYELDKKIVDSVVFSRINLKKDEFDTNYDIILCRNVMIYFDRKDQENIVHKFYDSLNKNGYLIIGHSEMLYFINNFFKYKKINDAPIYYKE